MTTLFRDNGKFDFVDPHTFHSFAGVDIVAQITLPGESGPIIFAEVQTISYSIHRENTPVRFLGRTNVAGYIKGPRAIAGSLIFTMFDQYAFYQLKQYQTAINTYGLYPLADMLPPFDVVLSFANEYGLTSTIRIYGITIVDEGATMSVDDLISEMTFTYMARGIQPIMRGVNANA